MKCRDYSGKLVEAPKDLPNVVASMLGGYLVWSHDGKRRYQVRYGLQVRKFAIDEDVKAGMEFGKCLCHSAACEGLLIA